MALRIKQLREDRELTQVQLAVKADTSPVTIVHIESGKRNPSLRMLEGIAAALDMSVVDLFEESAAPPPPDGRPEEVAALTESIREVQRWGSQTARRSDVSPGVAKAIVELEDEIFDKGFQRYLALEREGIRGQAIEDLALALAELVAGSVEVLESVAEHIEGPEKGQLIELAAYRRDSKQPQALRRAVEAG